MRSALSATALLAAILMSCSSETVSGDAAVATASRTPVLLVTLDTTRADAIGPDSTRTRTPSFSALAARGALFEYAYAAAPETLPSHASMMTGMYPAGHRVHENARALPRDVDTIAEHLARKGYATAAFVSAYPLEGSFGLARGFALYDDDLGDAAERGSAETTSRALRWIESSSASTPTFLWVHYFDPHYPYEPAEPWASEYQSDRYAGEVAAMDHQLGILIDAWRAKFGEDAGVIVVGDHGEALGDHGESQHGNLLYQGVMRVPLVVSGGGVTPRRVRAPSSTRRVFHTILDWAGEPQDLSLLRDVDEVVVGEAMRPFLSFGWQPQVMAVDGSLKVIQSGRIEAYDVARDPLEQKDVSESVAISRGIRQTLRDYPIPSLDAPPTADALSDEDRRQLASLGYVGSDVTPLVRPDAPRPVDMTHMFDDLDRASGLFVAGEYALAIPVFESIVTADPGNLMALLRLAAARTEIGDRAGALSAFRRAREIAPQSADVKHYFAIYHLAGNDLDRASALLEEVIAVAPERIPSLEALASVRERQRRIEDALQLRLKLRDLRSPEPVEIAQIGRLAMMSGNTPVAIESFEQLKSMQGSSFAHDLELGVLYMDARRFNDARQSLDRIAPTHPEYPLALFKRAQVSVLLREPDAPQRIEAARRNANEITRELIARERLFH